MSKKKFTLLCLIFNVQAALAQTYYSVTDIDNFAISKYRIRKIREIRVATPLSISDYNPNETCKGFKMTAAYAKFFFRHSHAISGNSYGHDYDHSSCSSNGTIVLADGYRGTWTLSRYGRGIMSLKKQNAEDVLMFLYCKRCDDIDNSTGPL